MCRPEMREDMPWSLAQQHTLASQTCKPPRFFKLTKEGEWMKQSNDGYYDKLSAKRLLKRLRMALSKPISRETTE